MKKIRIALLGAHINSTNLGCQALTYSLVSFLNELSSQCDVIFEYYLFEYFPSENETRKFCKQIHMLEERIYTIKIAPIFKKRSYINHFSENVTMIKSLKKCDYVIDLTAGDSFSDIYGLERFISLTKLKDYIEKKNIPLILGPQTYGPYFNKKNERFAAKVIKASKEVIARDEVSAAVASRLGKRIVDYTTDLAFQLPYTKARFEKNNLIRVGLNISGLLVKEHLEKGIENTISLKADYDEFVEGILSSLCSDGKYEIYLISHVKEDYEACKKYHFIFPNTILAPLFDNPVAVKSYISGLDLFVGSRMHATIAAFSSGVPTIPVAYSRKFEGMFNVVKYNRIVDLQNLNTNEAIDRTWEYITIIEQLKIEVDEGLKLCDSYKEKTMKFFKRALEL